MLKFWWLIKYLSSVPNPMSFIRQLSRNRIPDHHNAWNDLFRCMFTEILFIVPKKIILYFTHLLSLTSTALRSPSIPSLIIV